MKGTLQITSPSYGDGRKCVKISVKDSASRMKFIEVEIDYEQFTQALMGVYTSDNCEIKTRDLEHIGKTIVKKEVIAEMPKEYNYISRHKLAKEACEKILTEGWFAPTYFGSKDSFIMEDGVEYCKGIAFKYMEEV